jgi:hypothetical protein
MQALKSQAARLSLGRPLAMALVASASCAAWAADEPSPYYIGANEAVMHDSNVFRVPNGPGDYYSSTGLIGGFDQMISRQHVFASASLNYNKYHNQDTLNNTSYGVKGEWDWATIEKLTGSFTGSANQSLASFSGSTGIPTTARNLTQTDQLAASIRWGGEGLITLGGDYGHSRVHFSAPEYFTQQSSGDTGSIGAFYRLGADTKLGTAVRYTRSVSPYALPNGIVTDLTDPNQFHSLTSNGRNLDLSVDWRYSAQTNLNARLSWTHQTFSPDLPQLPGYSGLTGALVGNYAPTGKLTFNVSLNRDAGINSTFFNVVGAPSSGTGISLSQNSELFDTAAIGVRYAATAKISATAGYQYRHGDILNTVATTSNQTDVLHSANLGLTYDIARTWQLSCTYAHESRSISGTGGFFYTANVAGCMAQFTLR